MNNENDNYEVVCNGEKTIFSSKKIALRYFRDLAWLYEDEEQKKYHKIYEEIKKENNKYDDGTKIESERYFDEDDYENMGAVFVPSKELGDGWVWEKYNDGSGSLKSPDGKWYMLYDLSTNEYMPNEDSRWVFFPLSYYYADGADPNTFDCFKYMEKEMRDLILKQENALSI